MSRGPNQVAATDSTSMMTVNISASTVLTAESSALMMTRASSTPPMMAQFGNEMRPYNLATSIAIVAASRARAAKQAERESRQMRLGLGSLNSPGGGRSMLLLQRDDFIRRRRRAAGRLGKAYRRAVSDCIGNRP